MLYLEPLVVACQVCGAWRVGHVAPVLVPAEVAQVAVAERQRRPVVVQQLHGLNAAGRFTALQFPHGCQLKTKQLSN